MKRNILFIAICIFVFSISVFAENNSTLFDPEAFTLNSEQETYSLGEPVNLSFTFYNLSKDEVDIDCFGVGVGTFRVFISRDNINFLEYNGGWGTVDAICENRLKAGEKIQTPFVKVLWNQGIKDDPNLSHEVIKRARKTNIANDYAFSDAGVYYIKASAQLMGQTFDSKPIEIKISELIGDDLEVWELIKDDGNFSYFLQNAELNIPNFKKEERINFLKKIEDIISKYPDSQIAKRLSENVAQFKIQESKRAK